MLKMMMMMLLMMMMIVIIIICNIFRVSSNGSIPRSEFELELSAHRSSAVANELN
jgi:hypothetical protein